MTLILYIMQYIRNIVILTFNQYKKLKMRYFIFFLILGTKSLKSYSTLNKQQILILTSYISGVYISTCG